MIRFDKVGEILAKLKERLDFVIIGDTVVDLSLGRKGTESDVDLFVNDGLLIEEENLISLCNDNGWEMGRTPIDTPRIIANIGEQQLQIDLYENLQDFFVPRVVLDSAVPMKFGNVELPVVRLEDYVLLKLNAFREEDEEELKVLINYVGQGRLKLDRTYLASHMELFEVAKLANPS